MSGCGFLPPQSGTNISTPNTSYGSESRGSHSFTYVDGVIFITVLVTAEGVIRNMRGIVGIKDRGLLW